MCTGGTFPEVKRTGYEAHHLPQFSAEINA